MGLQSQQTSSTTWTGGRRRADLSTCSHSEEGGQRSQLLGTGSGSSFDQRLESAESLLGLEAVLTPPGGGSVFILSVGQNPDVTGGFSLNGQRNNPEVLERVQNSLDPGQKAPHGGAVQQDDQSLTSGDSNKIMY